MIIKLEGERPLSWNRYYAGAHWAERAAEAERVKSLVLAHVPIEPSPCQHPVDIIVTAYFKNRPQDPDNICSKLYIDALIGRILMDDNYALVHSVTTRSRVDKKNPRVEIEIREAI